MTPSPLDGERPEEEALGARAVLVLFLWLVVSLLATLAIPSLEAAGSFLSLSAVLLSIGALVISYAPLPDGAIRVILGGIFVALLLSTSGADVLFSEHRNIVTDLLVMLIVMAPAVLRIWSWRIQLGIGLVALLALMLGSHLHQSQSVLEPLSLLVITMLLSTILVLFRRAEDGNQSLRKLLDLPQDIEEVCLLRLPIQVWHVFVLQAGLLTTMILSDLSAGQNEFSAPLMAKVYGLVVVVLGAALAAVHRPSSLPRTLTSTTIALGVILSIVRVIDQRPPDWSHVLPLIFLAWITSILPWAVRRQIVALWAMLIADLALHLIGVASFTSLTPAIIGDVLRLHRAEYGLLACGFVMSVFAALAVRTAQLRHLSQYFELEGLTIPRIAAPRGARPVEQLRMAFEQERARQLLFGLFCFGIVSCAISTKLLMSAHAPATLWPTFTWVMFLCFWGTLALQIQRRPSWPHVWGMGALLALLLLLWPTLIIVQTMYHDNLWIYWTVCLGLGIAIIPWGVSETIPLTLVIVTIGAELSYRLYLSSAEFAGMLLISVLAAVASAQTTRRIRERHIFRFFTAELARCESEEDVTRAFVGAVSDLLWSGTVVFSVGDRGLACLRAEAFLPLETDAWPLYELAGSSSAGSPFSEYSGFRIIRWLPDGLEMKDRRLGSIPPSHGILVDDVAALYDGSSSTGAGGIPVFFATPVPLWEIFARRSIAVAGFCRDCCALRIAAIREARQVRAATDAAEQQSAQREYELGTLVHDINNTVQDMTLLCESILERLAGHSGATDGMKVNGASGDDETIAAVNRIAAVARSVATVVSDAKRRRELERLEDLTPRELVEVSEVVTELVSFARLRAERKRICVTAPQLPGEPAYVRISVREHLETILRNLLTNALLYSPPGGTVGVAVRIDEHWVEIDVCDTGFGLSAEECSSVFLPGFRGKSASATPGGLGLGLAESLRVARAAGGEIVAQSEGPGKGSTFTVRLPRQHRPLQVRTTSVWALLVDDQPSFTEFYAKIARSLQLQPVLASSVDEAISCVEERGRPGLVVTDIHLGTTDGLELVRALRRLFGTDLPILVISGLASPELNEQVRSAGATDFVAKPIGMRALYARVQSLLV